MLSGTEILNTRAAVCDIINAIARNGPSGCVNAARCACEAIRTGDSGEIEKAATDIDISGNYPSSSQAIKLLLEAVNDGEFGDILDE